MEFDRLHKMPTLLDVARRANVNASTVSRVLNEKPDIKIRSETRDRIIEAARELNYQPNSIARGLKLRRTFVLAILIPDIANIFSHEVIKGVEKAANEEGYSVLISQMENHVIKDLHVKMVREKRIDGLLIFWAYKEDEFLAELTKANIPFMLINRPTRITSNYITTDYFSAAKMAIEHLIALGHRNIALLPGHLDSDNSWLELKGYRQSLSDHGVPYQPDLVEESGFSYEDGCRGIASLLTKSRVFTAVFCNNLIMAIGAIHELQKSGIKIPEEVSVIGCHDASLAEMVRPTLTTVKMPLYELGYETAKSLIGTIDSSKGRENAVPRVLPPVGLIIRESTAKVNPYTR